MQPVADLVRSGITKPVDCENRLEVFVDVPVIGTCVRIQTDGHYLAAGHEHPACFAEKSELVLKVMKSVDTENTFERTIGPRELLRPGLRDHRVACRGAGKGQHASGNVYPSNANRVFTQQP